MTKNTTLEFLINSEDELHEIVKILIAKDYSKTVLLKGTLGAGKTAFVKAYCAALKTEDEVSSPTFALVNEYHSENGQIHHIDLYRLDSYEEALDIGIEEYLSTSGYCFIEWPELIESLISENYIEVNIKSTETNQRNLLISFL